MVDNDSKSNSSRWQDLDRRTILESVGSTIGLSGIAGIVKGRKQNDTITYPKFVSGAEVIDYIEVPKDWDQHRLHVKEVLNENREQLESPKGVISTEMVEGEEKYGGKTGFAIQVVVNDRYEEGSHPEQQDGVKIKIEHSENGYFTGGACEDQDTSSDNCTNNEDTDRVDGGQNLGWAELDAKGSSGCRCSYNGSEALLTGGHLFWKNCDDATSNDLTGRNAEAVSELVGETTKVDVKGDWAVVDNSFGGEYTYYIDDNDAFPYVDGYITEDTLDAWVSTDDCLVKMGRTTGLTHGAVKATNVSYTNPDCTDMRGEGVKTNASFAEGDSGCPTYRNSNGDAYIASITCYRYDVQYLDTACFNKKGDKSAGITADWIVNNSGVSIGSNDTY